MAAVTSKEYCREYYNNYISNPNCLAPPACLLCDWCTGLTEDERKFHCAKFGELKLIREAWQASICTSYHDEYMKG